jgi:hypothetical protein
MLLIDSDGKQLQIWQGARIASPQKGVGTVQSIMRDLAMSKSVLFILSAMLLEAEDCAAVCSWTIPCS